MSPEEMEAVRDQFQSMLDGYLARKNAQECCEDDEDDYDDDIQHVTLYRKLGFIEGMLEAASMNLVEDEDSYVIIQELLKFMRHEF